MGPISGWPKPSGMSSRACGSRSMTSCRQKYMFIPSSKNTVTADRPKRETERISVIPGRPLMAVSTGKVMNCSTSTGPRPSELVRIRT